MSETQLQVSEQFNQKPSDQRVKHQVNVVLMLGQRRRRWTSIKPTLRKRPVCAGMNEL